MIELDRNGEPPLVIPYMPAGEHRICATINGEPGERRVVVDAAAVGRLNADLAELLDAARAGRKARPVLFFDHKPGEAAAFPRRFIWGGEELGILLELSEWSAAGRAAILGRNYGYISPAFRLSRKDGQVLGLVGGVEVASLVNDPAFERIAPITDAIAAARATELPEGVDIVGAAHCNQHGHAPGCTKGDGAEIEINFQTEYKTKREWLEAARAYFMEHYAGRTFAIGNTGHTLHVGTSDKRMKLVTKGVNAQKRFESFKKLEDIIAQSSHISSEDAIAKPGQGHHKADIVAHTATFEKYGAQAVINGEKNIIWFNAQTKQKGAKDVLLYEFGVSAVNKGEGDSPTPAVSSTVNNRKATLNGDIKAQRATDVNSYFAGKDAEGERARISTNEELAKGQKGPHNGGAAKKTGNLSMTEETKKKLGLAPDADAAAVDAAVADLLKERDAHKKKAEEAQAECKKKDDELKAARAAEKETWLNELKARGVLAPQDEEAVSAAGALFEANAAAARTAYAKMGAVDNEPIIQASHALPAGNKGERPEDFIDFN